MSSRNRVMLLAFALLSLVFLASCGSSYNPPHPPPGGGFSNSNFKGTYVFSTIGSDALGHFQQTTGTLVADGNGSITGGTFDVNNPGGIGVVAGITVGSGSNYRVTVDGRGAATVNTATAGTWGFDFVLTSSQGGMITEFDSAGTGSGTLELQSSVVQTDLAGSYALNLTGADGAVNVMSTVAGFTLDAAGNMSNGIQDINDSRTVLTSLSLSGTVLVGASGAPGTAALVTSTSLGTLHFDLFPVSASHLKFIETDGTAFLAGDAFPQSSSVPAATNVFTLSGLDFTSTNPVPFVAGGFLVTDGSGNVMSTSSEDINDGGTVATQVTFSGLYGTTLTNGRTTMTLLNFNNGSLSSTTTFAAYPSAGGLQLLQIDTTNAGVTSGVAYTQTPGAALASGQGYGLNLTGFNLNGEEDDIAEFTNTNGSFTGLVDFNDEVGSGADNLTFGQRFTAAYTADSSNSGRGQIASNAFNLISYALDGSTTVFIEVDTNPPQVAVGSLGVQNAAAMSNAAARHLAVLRLTAAPKHALVKRH